MGTVFSSNLIQDKISGAINVAISVINQCQQTLNSIQGLTTNGCPGLFLAGLSFNSSEIITESCFNSDTTFSQIESEINNYLQEQADLDIAKYKLTDSQRKTYKQLMFNLAQLIIKNTIGFTEDYFTDNKFVCKNTSLDVEVVPVLDLKHFLSNNVFNTVVNSKEYTDLIDFFKTTQESSNRSMGLLTILILLIILFIIVVVLLFLGLSCGWAVILSLIIFLLFEVSISFTLK